MEHGPEREPNYSQEIAQHLAAEFGDEFGFDPETVEEIAAMPFEEAFETAFGYLAQTGVEPEEALSAWMEEPAEEQV